MTLKMIVEFEDGQEPKAVMQEVLKNCKKVEDMTARSSYKNNERKVVTRACLKNAFCKMYVTFAGDSGMIFKHALGTE